MKEQNKTLRDVALHAFLMTGMDDPWERVAKAVAKAVLEANALPNIEETVIGIEREKCAEPCTCTKAEKPPIGLNPRWLHEEQRIQQIESAIMRYEDFPMPVPKEWRIELAELKLRQLQRS